MTKIGPDSFPYKAAVLIGEKTHLDTDNLNDVIVTESMCLSAQRLAVDPCWITSFLIFDLDDLVIVRSAHDSYDLCSGSAERGDCFAE